MPWQEFCDNNQLLAIFDLSKKANAIKFCLSFYRILQCSGVAPMKKYQGTIASALKRFILD